MVRLTRPIAWIKGALKDFREFPEEAQRRCWKALTIAAEGGKADFARPLRGFGSGVLEIALPYRGDAFRVVYAVQLEDMIWVLHAFQKKSTHGIATPRHEMELVLNRLKQLRQMVREHSV